MKTSSHGIALIKKFEGLRTTAYRCPAGILTIGYGHTSNVKKGDICTELEAEHLLESDLGNFEKGLEKALNADEIVVNQYQFDALISFSYNVGLTRLVNSTLWKYLKHSDYSSAAYEFLKWNRVNGQVSKGLSARRQAEMNMFLS